MKQIKISGLHAALALLAACGTNALAAIDGPFTTSTPISPTPTDLSGDLVFPQFNSSLGTLTQVELDLSTTLTTTLTVQNVSPGSSQGTAKTQVQFTVQDPGNNFTAPALSLLSPAYAYTLGAGQMLTSGVLSKSGSLSEIYTSSSILSEFTGPGDISLSAGTQTLAFRSNTGGNTAAFQVTDASCTGQVIYTYTPTAIPEPSALGLTFGLPALILGARPLLRRIRQ